MGGKVAFVLKDLVGNTEQIVVVVGVLSIEDLGGQILDPLVGAHADGESHQ